MKYQQLSLEQQVQRVRDAWFARTQSADPFGDPPWPVHIFEDHMIVEGANGFLRVPYTVGEDDMITFGEPEKVMQEFVAAELPTPVEEAGDRRSLSTVAQEFVRATARLFGAEQDGEVAITASDAQIPDSGEGWLLQVPFRVYRDDDERYVGGLVLTPGDDNAYGDIWDAHDIRVLAHRFMEQSRHIDYMHTTKVVAAPVESYYFPTEAEGGQAEYTVYGETVPGGSWWLGSRVQDDDTWDEVKAGKLRGYSMFAVKLADGSEQENSAYVAGEDAPGGRRMTAEDWDITMVSLVDEPAVRKATYVVLRRAPDGKPVMTPTTVQQPDNAEEVEAMKSIGQITAYHDETDRRSEAAVTDSGEKPVLGEEGPGDNQSEQSDAATTPAEQDQPNELLAEVRAAVREELTAHRKQIEETVAARVGPLEDSIRELETRQARLSGAGALPGSHDSSEATSSKKTARGPSWVNYGSGPKTAQPLDTERR